jgi:hypothetical protein
MNPLVAWVRRASTATLVAIGAAAVVVFVAVNVVLSLGSGRASPPPRVSLEGLSLRLLSDPTPPGLSADFTYVDTLFPDPSLMPQDLASTAGPLLGSSRGRLWWRPGELRVDFESSQGDTELLVTGDRALLYNAASGVAVSAQLPAISLSSILRTVVSDASTAASAATSSAAVRPPLPGVTADRPSYTLTIEPRGDPRVQLTSAQVVTDAASGLPLKLDLYARGATGPALQMVLSNVHIGSIDPSDLHFRLPFGVNPQPLQFSRPPSIGGASPCGAPAALAGLQLVTCRQASGGPNATGRLLVYGSGAGSLFVLEQPTTADPTGGLWQLLPGVNIGDEAGRELTTALGTLVRFGRNGIEYTLVASLPRAVVEQAARGL